MWIFVEPLCFVALCEIRSLVIGYCVIFVTYGCNPAQKCFIYDWLEGSV